MSGVTDKDMGYRAFKQILKGVQDRELVVGYLSDQSEIATYAAANEFGANLVNGGEIPARPFMRPTIDNNRKKYGRMIRDGVRQVIARQGDPAGAYVKTGLQVRTDIIRTIHSVKKPPNEPSTIRQKKSSKPLQDTGAMQQALNFEVRRRGAS